MTKKPKKRNPQDATLRNLSALKKRVAKLEAIVADKWLEYIVAAFTHKRGKK
jgi:hypothetical protein